MEQENVILEDVFAEMKSSRVGLSEQEAQERLASFGKNELTEKKKTTALKVFAGQFVNLIVWVLAAAAVISLAIGETIDFWVIMFTIAVVITLGFIQEYRAEKAMEALKSIVQPETTVLRDKRLRKIFTVNVVPGDILVLETGDKIPADSFVFEAVALKIDESALTGESVPVGKNENDTIFAGTQLVHGKCKALVTSTGMNTKIGQIASLIQTKDEDTPLQTKITKLSLTLAFLAVLASAITFAIGIYIGAPFGDMLLISLALAVAAVPEGLPLTLTITLAYGMKKMAGHNAIIRKMLAVETLGSTTIICTDKTGTLTRNEMTVEKLFVSETEIDVTGSGYIPKGDFLKRGNNLDLKNDGTTLDLLRGITLCNNSAIEKKGEKWEVVGDPTEIALTVAAAKADLWKDELDKNYEMTEEIVFTSERKIMTTIHKTESGFISFTKGAPEYVLPQCSVIEKNGDRFFLTEKDREIILDKNLEFASSAYRVLAVACKEESVGADTAEFEKDMIFLGLVAMIDPPREEAKEAVEMCRKAGIKVIMITGDNQETAKAIGRNIGLFDGKNGCGVYEDEKLSKIAEDCAVTGDELEELNDEEFDIIVDNINVYARTMPEQKLRIVNALQKKGHIVAMTGDGVNDAPALKKADIGIAMGIKGTDVAKESSVMILQDDNFATIVEAIRGGRTIYNNIEKFITYLISRNFMLIILIMAGISLLGFDLIPLLALQILFINMFNEIMPAVSLGLDPATEGIMTIPPRDPNDNFLKKRNLFLVITLAFAMGSASFLVFEMSDPVADTSMARTLTFATVVSMILFIPLAFRSLEKSVFSIGIFSNRLMIAGVTATFFATVSVMYIPKLNDAFGLIALSPSEWLMPIAVAFITFLIAEGLKYTTRSVKK
ncbi:cation-translocating P-type ATPase [Methanolobus sediminis]|uniref:Cation-translocating P-type ATPase n=1 Tax=Methanolobus sediminis TaxID=3072978 RepID=A0AA51UIC7_9EURY|nr:cation-translocating P-type ATPase [Methanolobus sediminis]WMW24039.1 cation-translocating P-type ATPase [Methanolobus sediminis]